jgi:hypothetical protein
MSKTALTRLAEEMLWYENAKLGIYGCFEVTIGIGGQEIVDFITYDSNGVFKCYEIKVSMADFNSNARKSFYGDFNYFVVTPELFKKLKEKQMLNYSNQNIGFITFSERGLVNVRKANRRQISFGDRGMLLESIVRSSNRELRKFYKLNPYWGEMEKLNEPK